MISSRVVRSALGTLALVAGACAHAPQVAPQVASSSAAYVSTPSSTSSAPVRADVGLRLIEGRALSTEPHRSFYDVLTHYWPNVESPPWQLRSNTVTELDRIGVYATRGGYLGGLEQFREIPAARIARVKRLTPNEEFFTYGRQHVAGALVIDWADGIR